MEKLILIDGNSLLNRAFFATPVFTTKDGTPTNGVFGFVKLFLRIVADKKPTHAAVAFDLHAPTFRHKMYTDYKAGRKPMPDDLVVQVPILKEVLRMMGIMVCEQEGYEADDLIGTVAKMFSAQTYIYTGDRDSYQLVDASTNVCFTRKGVSDILELTADNFYDEIGLTPAQIIDLKSLMGDKSDNIPGVPGVGEKTAKELLEKYGDLDNVYAHLDEIKGALHKKLADNKDIAYFSRKLATINVNVPMDITLSDCVLKMPFDRSVRDKFAELEFRSLVSKDIYLSEAEQTAARSADSVTITEYCPSTIDEALGKIRTHSSHIVSLDWRDKEIRLYWANSDVLEELVLPIKNELLDVGFFENQLSSILSEVFRPENTIVAYNVKDVMRRARMSGVEFCSAYEDVSVLKYLADGLGNAYDVDFCISSFSLPERNKAYSLAQLRNEYITRLGEQEKKLYYDMELPLVRVLYEMETEGVCVDTEALFDLSKRYNEEINKLTTEIFRLAGETFNINSTQQLGRILFEKLKIGDGVKKNKDSKSYKTTAEELEKYAENSEIVRHLLRYRKIQKLNSTYIDGFKPLLIDGKVHTTYNQSLTQTGRLSSSNPNLQNIPIRTDEGRELRKLFIAKPGNVLIDADYSQIELRLLAHLSDCKALIRAYCAEKDIHAITASQVFNIPVCDVTEELRQQAKAVNFGIIYGISAFGLANDLNTTPQKAKKYIERYFDAYPEIKMYMEANVEKAARDGYVTTMFGRRRVINEIRSSNYNIRSFGERAAMNMPTQGANADIIKLAMLHVHEKLEQGKYKAKLVLQVHDELVIDSPVEEAEEVAALLKTEMENVVSLRVPLTVEVCMGKNWFTAK